MMTRVHFEIDKQGRARAPRVVDGEPTYAS
jgi:hypothetical protein